ncbi:MAG: H/ACA ribonucleoprotein complex subunit GAR1 [Nitrosopumilaceae archaeon]
MQEVGEIMHLANSGRVIIRLSKTLEEGQIICDEKSSKIAKVTEMIGPIGKPYASAIPLTNNVKKYVGKKVFALVSSPVKKYKKLRRKRNEHN